MPDDFFLVRLVDVTAVLKCIDWMEEDKYIAVFGLYKTFVKNIGDNAYPGFKRKKRCGKHCFSCQAAVWRRSRLISLMRDFESPWLFEVVGNKRSFRVRDQFYVIKEDNPLRLIIMEANTEFCGANGALAQ
ncbi:MAG: hypothetical protein RR244_04400 [Oscillospiraceae bacterium]